MTEFFLISLLTLVASAAGTVSGFGISTMMMPVMLLFMPVLDALLFVGVIHIFGNIWKVTLFYRGIRWKLILSFGIPGIISSYAGAKVIPFIDQSVLRQTLGIVLLLYALSMVIKPNLKLKTSLPVSVGSATLSGFVAGMIGVGGALRGAALSLFNLQKGVYISANGAIALIIDLIRIVVYLDEGAQIPIILLMAF